MCYVCVISYVIPPGWYYAVCDYAMPGCRVCVAVCSSAKTPSRETAALPVQLHTMHQGGVFYCACVSYYVQVIHIFCVLCVFCIKYGSFVYCALCVECWLCILCLVCVLYVQCVLYGSFVQCVTFVYCVLCVQCLLCVQCVLLFSVYTGKMYGKWQILNMFKAPRCLFIYVIIFSSFRAVLKLVQYRNRSCGDCVQTVLL